MAEKSKYAVAFDKIQAKVYEFLKPIAFRKKGRTFNREADVLPQSSQRGTRRTLR